MTIDVTNIEEMNGTETQPDTGCNNGNLLHLLMSYHVYCIPIIAKKVDIKLYPNFSHGVLVLPFSA